MAQCHIQCPANATWNQQSAQCECSAGYHIQGKACVSNLCNLAIADLQIQGLYKSDVFFYAPFTGLQNVEFIYNGGIPVSLSAPGYDGLTIDNDRGVFSLNPNHQDYDYDYIVELSKSGCQSSYFKIVQCGRNSIPTANGCQPYVGSTKVNVRFQCPADTHVLEVSTRNARWDKLKELTSVEVEVVTGSSLKNYLYYWDSVQTAQEVDSLFSNVELLSLGVYYG